MSCAQWRAGSEQFCRMGVAIIRQLRRQDYFNGTSQTSGDRFAEFSSFLCRRLLRRAEMPGAARGHFCFPIGGRIIGAPRQEYHVPIVRAILVTIPINCARGHAKLPKAIESSRKIVLVTAPDYTPRRRWLGAKGGTECEFSIPGLEGERVTYY